MKGIQKTYIRLLGYIDFVLKGNSEIIKYKNKNYLMLNNSEFI